MRGCVPVLVFLGIACGSNSTNLDAGANDGLVPSDALVGDAPVDAIDAAITPLTYPLGLNDISTLFQLPEDRLHGVTFGFLSGIPGTASGDLVPRTVFHQLVTEPGDVGKSFDAFHVVALRFDLCDRLGPSPCAPGADGQLRLVFQTLTDGPYLQHPTSTEDVALHAFYPIPGAELASVVKELRVLAYLRGFQTASPLAINESLASTSPPSEYRTRLRELVARYATGARLQRLSLFSQDANRPIHNWVFRAVQRTNGTFELMSIPVVSATEQNVEMVSPPWPPTFASTPTADVPVGTLLAHDATAFDLATPAERQTALGALTAAQNPTLHGFGTAPCVVCHVATSLTHDRAASASVSVANIPNTYQSAHDVSIAFGVAETTQVSLRAFGWIGWQAAISNRVANETAVVLDEIEQRYPANDPTMLPDAGVPDAPPMVKRAFVTFHTYRGDLRTAGNAATGAIGADNLCNAAAIAGGLGGQWRAWVSTTGMNAIDRVTGSGPWYLTDRTTLAFPDRTALTSGPLAAINLTEFVSQPPGTASVWTGTRADGTMYNGYTCNDWTSVDSNPNNASGVTGIRYSTEPVWTEYYASACSNELRLYCFEE